MPSPVQVWTQQVSEDAEGVVTFTYRQAPSPWQCCTSCMALQTCLQANYYMTPEGPAMLRGTKLRCLGTCRTQPEGPPVVQQIQKQMAIVAWQPGPNRYVQVPSQVQPKQNSKADEEL